MSYPFVVYLIGIPVAQLCFLGLYKLNNDPVHVTTAISGFLLSLLSWAVPAVAILLALIAGIVAGCVKFSKSKYNRVLIKSKEPTK